VIVAVTSTLSPGGTSPDEGDVEIHETAGLADHWSNLLPSLAIRNWSCDVEVPKSRILGIKRILGMGPTSTDNEAVFAPPFEEKEREPV
jgi:hypothetical protein